MTKHLKNSRGSAVVGLLLALIVLLLAANAVVIALCFRVEAPPACRHPHRGPHHCHRTHSHGNGDGTPYHHAGTGTRGIHRHRTFHR